MIRDARKLKAKIHNLTHGDSNKSQIYLRNFFMERFLERISVSSYQENFVLKGGLLIASLVGFDLRATLDIDSTVKSIPLNEKDATQIIQEIIDVPLNDHVDFILTSVSVIMENLDYPGIRFTLLGSFDRICQTIRIDLSTDDVITPKAISYNYKLMFVDRNIQLMAYNPETMLAEKIETIIARGTANTRMRDFYDVFLLSRQGDFDLHILRNAIMNTSKKRNSEQQLANYSQIIQEVASSSIMEVAWDGFKHQSYFAGDLSWQEVVGENIMLIKKALPAIK